MKARGWFRRIEELRITAKQGVSFNGHHLQTHDLHTENGIIRIIVATAAEFRSVWAFASLGRGWN